MNETSNPAATAPTPGESPNPGPAVPGPDDLRAKAGEVKAAGRGQYPRQGVKRGPYKGKGDPKTAPPQGSTQPAGEMFNDQNTARLLRIPFDVWAIRANVAGLALDEEECKELVATARPTLNTWVGVDPKWVALATLGVSLVGIISYKLAWLAAFQEMQRRQGRVDAPAPGGPAGGSKPEPARGPAAGPEGGPSGTPGPVHGPAAPADIVSSADMRERGLLVPDGAWIAGGAPGGSAPPGPESAPIDPKKVVMPRGMFPDAAKPKARRQ